MFKFLVPVCLGLAVCCPTNVSGQDCCHDDFDAACQPTRKRLALVESCIDIKRLRRVCETDECGNSRKRLALVSEPVSFKRLGLVDVPVDPCRPNILERMRGRMPSLGLRDRMFGGDDCCDGGCDGDWGHAAGCGTDGHHFSHDHYGTPADALHHDSHPRMIQPRESFPRQVMPREVSPRIPGDNYYAPPSSPSIIESPLEIHNHSG